MKNYNKINKIISCLFICIITFVVAVIFTLSIPFFKKPLHFAVKIKSIKLTSFLIRMGTNINAYDKSSASTPLHYSTYEGSEKIASLLIKNGANVNAKNKFGLTPLHYASYKGNKKIASLLIENEADVNKTNTDRWLIWIHPVEAELMGYLNLRNTYNWSPLHYASSQGHKEIVSLLIKYGANVNVENKSGLTPLHYAKINGYEEISSILIEHGANLR